MERTMSQQARELWQLHQTINRMARMLEAHAVREEMQRLGMKEWLEDRETQWDERQYNNVIWGMGITDITTKVPAKAGVGKAPPAQEARKQERDETARHESGRLEATQHADATQDGEPEKRQLQQQPKPKPKLLFKQQPELQHEPKPKPEPTLARGWETVQL